MEKEFSSDIMYIVRRKKMGDVGRHPAWHTLCRGRKGETYSWYKGMLTNNKELVFDKEELAKAKIDEIMKLPDEKDSMFRIEPLMIISLGENNGKRK